MGQVLRLLMLPFLPLEMRVGIVPTSVVIIKLVTT